MSGRSERGGKVPVGNATGRPYSPALLAGPYAFVSGQVGTDPATGHLAGPDIEGQTDQALKNIAALLAQAGLTLNDVVKATVFMTDMAEFARMNEVYRSHFQEPMPTRSAVEVSCLARPELKVEIEAIALRGEDA